VIPPQVGWFEVAVMMMGALFFGREAAAVLWGAGLLGNRELLRGQAAGGRAPREDPPVRLPRFSELLLLVAIVALGLSLLFEVDQTSRLASKLVQECEILEGVEKLLGRVDAELGARESADPR
jgi:hypothetical protein